jgi:hypothetical protein
LRVVRLENIFENSFGTKTKKPLAFVLLTALTWLLFGFNEAGSLSQQESRGSFDAASVWGAWLCKMLCKGQPHKGKKVTMEAQRNISRIHSKNPSGNTMQAKT